MTALKAGLFFGVIFLLLDGLWLGVIARGFLQDQLGPLMREKIDVAPAAAFYLIYIAAATWLAVLPAIETGGWTKAALSGAVLGLAAYATYDLTNLSTLKGWPVKLVFVDLAWGTALTAVAAAGATQLAKMV